MYSTFFAVEDISNIDFVKNRKMTHIVEDAVSCYFRHAYKHWYVTHLLRKNILDEITCFLRMTSSNLQKWKEADYEIDIIKLDLSLTEMLITKMELLSISSKRNKKRHVISMKKTLQ